MRSVAGRLPIACMLVAAALAAPAAARAQDSASAAPAPRYRARILGVFDEQSGEPLENVRVLDVLNGNSALTTKTGTVALSFLPDGGSLVRLQKIGYATQTLTLAISPTDTAPVTITLQHVAELPKVVTRDSAPAYISPHLRGFVDRMKTENGYFIDEATLRKNDNRTLANLLRTKPGIQIVEGLSNASFLMRSPRCLNGGPPQVFLDGVPLSPVPLPTSPRQKTTVFGVGGGGNGVDDMAQIPFNLSDYNIPDLAGVEWYPDGTVMPIEFFKSNNRCGALMLWTREK